tara:strand:- start:5816 stop:6442 length:627 start_codon:yes stop_codon:yes gene_type:complete
MDLYSYVVRYDSGFAPNPFYGYCTLATCKPPIRKSAKVGDWIIGSGSADKRIKQGDKLVYAMRVSEILSFNEYFNDPRFEGKKPILTGSRKQARGDNIYHQVGEEWQQLDSYHSHKDGSPNEDHIKRDTDVDKVLIGDQYIYFGADGPKIPDEFQSHGKSLCHSGIGRSKFSSDNENEKVMIDNFINWVNTLGVRGFVGHPYDWCDSQ